MTAQAPQVPASGAVLVIPVLLLSKHNHSCSRGSHFCPFSISSYGLGSRSPPGCFHLVPPCPWWEEAKGHEGFSLPRGQRRTGGLGAQLLSVAETSICRPTLASLPELVGFQAVNGGESFGLIQSLWGQPRVPGEERHRPAGGLRPSPPNPYSLSPPTQFWPPGRGFMATQGVKFGFTERLLNSSA